MHYCFQEFAVGTKFQSSVTQLTSRTGIEPVKLRLDDVGYNYQNVFVAALVSQRITFQDVFFLNLMYCIMQCCCCDLRIQQ